MLKHFVACITCVITLTACTRFREHKMIGTWRFENEDGVEEISLHQDHSFWSLNTFKKELVEPSVIEQTGSWRLKGHQLLLDSTITWSKTRAQFSRTFVRVTNSALVMKSLDGTKNFSYQRLEEAACSSSDPPARLTKAVLVGSWKTHYNTHDYQYRFGPDGRVELFAGISDDSRTLMEGHWDIKDDEVLIRFEKASYGPLDKEEEEKWTIIGVGPDCIALNSAPTRPRILRRMP
jgi:hypothetical protein